jgi:hypothetical protein
LCRITPSGSLYDEFDFCHTRALVKPICRGRPLCGGLEAAASVSPKWPNLPARAREHLAKAGRVSVFFDEVCDLLRTQLWDPEAGWQAD